MRVLVAVALVLAFAATAGASDFGYYTPVYQTVTVLEARRVRYYERVTHYGDYGYVYYTEEPYYRYELDAVEKRLLVGYLGPGGRLLAASAVPVAGRSALEADRPSVPVLGADD
jgi:hypothetical protein